MGLGAFGVTPEADSAPEVEPEPAAVPEVDSSPVTPADRLARLRASMSPPEPTDGVQKEMDALRTTVDSLRNDLSDLGKSDAPAAALDINYDDPNVGAAFREVYEDGDPAAFGRAVGAVVKVAVDGATANFDKQISEVRAETTQAREDHTTSENFASNIKQSLNLLRTYGESEAAIVEDYLANGGSSFLGEWLNEHPALTGKVADIVASGIAVARMVEIADARNTSTPAAEGEPATPQPRSVRTEAAPTTGSNRSVQRIRDDAEGKDGTDLTPEEQLRHDIVNAASPGARLPGVFR